MGNGKTLGFCGDEKVKDAKIVFDREATMMVVEVSRGV
jgi:ribonuclease BN (tRNA processing enzyme)